MSVQVQIVGTKDNPVEVTPNGEQVVTTLAFAIARYVNIEDTNTLGDPDESHLNIYNLYSPRSGFRLRVAGIQAKGDRQITVNGTLVTLYEALTPTTGVVERVLYKTELSADQFASAVPVFQAREGFFINVKREDSNNGSVHFTSYANFVPTPTEDDPLS